MPILKLFETNRTTDPDLTVTSEGDHFLVFIKDPDGRPKKTMTLPWRYARLELFADEGTDPTFVVPTIVGDGNSSVEIAGGKNGSGVSFKCSEVSFKCQMVLLNGAGARDSSASSTVLLFMHLYRRYRGPGYVTLLSASHDNPNGVDQPNPLWGGIGDTGWTGNPDPRVNGTWPTDFSLDQIGEAWFTKRSPQPQANIQIDDRDFPLPRKKRDFPGPLLQSIFPNNNWPGQSKLHIHYVPATRNEYATLAFVFRPGRSWTTSFPLPLGPAQSSFHLPLAEHIEPSNSSAYRLVQRPSGHWLTRHPEKIDPTRAEWLIAVDAPGDVQKTWNDAVIEYNRALRDVRSVNRVSLLPLLKDYRANTTSSLDLDQNESLSFQLRAEFLVSLKKRDAALADPVTINDLEIQPVRVKPFGTDISATLQYFLNIRGAVPAVLDPKNGTDLQTAMQQQSILYDAKIEPIEPANALAAAFGFKATLTKKTPGISQSNQKVRIGSLDLTFGGDPTKLGNDPGPVQIFQMIDLSPTTVKIIPRFLSQMNLPLLAVTPGGQDGLPASEYAPENASASQALAERCIERRFNGSAPIVIPVYPKPDDTQTAPAFRIQIDESNQDTYSQTVALKLQSLTTKAANSKPPRVIVIDSDPFLVAAIDYQQLTGSNSSNVVALWNTGAIEGAAWQLQTGDQPFTLTLPPQGIGEEMPKNDKDGIGPTPLGFRLSPPAHQTLKASYFAQNFTEAPWNLRRILGYPGQRDAGAGVVSLNFELLYGLACTVDAPLLRLAEIFALVGRIAGRISRKTFVASFPTKQPITIDQINDAYERKRWDWSLVAELYSKRVALLEPRASGNNYGSTAGVTGASAAPEVFTLSDGVSCSFRSTADLYYSANPNYKDPKTQTGVDDDTFPVVNTGLKGGVTWPFESSRIFHATVRNPKSSSATASGLALSPLGGTGTVKAGFDKDLSTITATTEIGRTSKETVARLGRIGVFHNLARYVIEYERDTSPSQQFSDNHIEFNRIPVLRKVREFVEVLEPVATLSNSSQTYPGAGCVRSIEFKQRFIPVSSDWSSNVGDNGWKIPLWYKPDSLEQPIRPDGTKPYVYKLPEVVFNFAGTEDADVECGILSVDKLFFYTETDADADADPHRWPLVSGIDFLPVPVPTPNAAFESNKPHEIPAYDPVTPFGLATFTHQLDKGHARVNLVEGRSATAIGANLLSVTLQRAPAQISGLQTKLQTIHDNIRGDLFHAVRQDPSNIFNLAQKVCDAATDLQKDFDGKVQALVNGAQTKERALLQSAYVQFQQEIAKATDELYSYLNQEVNIVGMKIDDAKKLIIPAVNAQVKSFGCRLGGITDTTNGLAQFCACIDTTLKGAQGELLAVRTAILQALQTARDRMNDASTDVEQKVALVKAALTGPIDRCNALLDQVRTQVLARIEIWMPAAPLICHAWEQTIHGNLLTAQAVLTQADVLLSFANAKVDDQVQSATDAVKQLVAKAQTDVGALAFPPGLLTAFDDATKDSQAVNVRLKNLAATVTAEIDGYITEVVSNLSLTIISNSVVLRSLIDGVSQKTIARAADFLKNAQDDIDKNTAKYSGLLKSYSKGTSDEVCDAVKGLQAAALNQMEAYRRTLEDSLGRFAESVAHFLPPVDIKMPIGVSLPALLNRAFGAVPEIPNLGFSLPSAAYFYLPSLPHVPLTPLLTQVKDLIPNLSPLSTMLPSFALSDRALPVPHLPNFDLNGILPDFAGLKLDNLFPALKMPFGSSDAVKVTHGTDTASRTAWIQADIDLKTDTAVIFSIGPMALQIVTPRFTSKVRAQAGANGQVSKEATGAITGDWQLLIGGSPMITLRNTGLTFDKNGKLHVDVSPDRVELSQALAFIQEIIAAYSSPDSGFGIYPSLTGIETRLSLPIPNTSVGTTGITNLTFNFLFGLSWANDFNLYAGFGLASPNAPFNLSIFILGGGGHLVATALYHPGGSLTCQVDMALDASAALAISLGPISGSVHINLGMRFIFNSGQGDLSLGIFLLIGGEVSILSVVSAQVMLKLEATYSGGVFTCRGIFSISIKICWCFTLEVHEEVHCSLGSGGGIAYLEEPLPMLRHPKRNFEALMVLDSSAISTIPPQTTLDTYPRLAANYLSLID